MTTTLWQVPDRYRRNADELLTEMRKYNCIMDLGIGIAQIIAEFGAGQYLKCVECPQMPNVPEFLIKVGEDDLPERTVRTKDFHIRSSDNGDGVEIICLECSEYCYCPECEYQGFGTDTYPCYLCEVIVCDGCAVRFDCGPLCVDCRTEFAEYDDDDSGTYDTYDTYDDDEDDDENDEDSS